MTPDEINVDSSNGSVDHGQRLEKLEDSSWTAAEIYRIVLWANDPISSREVAQRLVKNDSYQNVRTHLIHLQELGYVSRDNEEELVWSITTSS